MERSARRAIIRAPWRRPMRSMRCAATAIQAVARGRAARRARDVSGSRATAPSSGARPSAPSPGSITSARSSSRARGSSSVARGPRAARSRARARRRRRRRRRAAATVQRAWGRAADRRIFTFYASTVRAAGALPEGFLSSAAGGRGARALGSALLPSGVAGSRRACRRRSSCGSASARRRGRPRSCSGSAPRGPSRWCRSDCRPAGLRPAGRRRRWRPLPRRGSETRARTGRGMRGSPRGRQQARACRTYPRRRRRLGAESSRRCGDSRSPERGAGRGDRQCAGAPRDVTSRRDGARGAHRWEGAYLGASSRATSSIRPVAVAPPLGLGGVSASKGTATARRARRAQRELAHVARREADRRRQQRARASGPRRARARARAGRRARRAARARARRRRARRRRPRSRGRRAASARRVRGAAASCVTAVSTTCESARSVCAARSTASPRERGVVSAHSARDDMTPRRWKSTR